MAKPTVDPWCVGCIHVNYMGQCDYFPHTGHTRGCPAGEGCHRRELGQKPRPRCILPPERKAVRESSRLGSVRPAPAVIALDRDETALRLYAEGATDPEIAQATGWSVSSVCSWRRLTCRQANGKRKKDRHGTENREPERGPG
jgi:hypothetical protein